MKVTTSTVFDILSRLRAYFQGGDFFPKVGHDEPFRSELYSSVQMERHARVVARSHKLIKRDVSDSLLKRLGENETTLLKVRDLLAESIRSGQPITPGAEWLLDNFYLIEEQVVIARKHLPKGYSEDLPYLENGLSAGMPRVYDIVLEIISHSDGRVDFRSLSNFISAYQTHTLLTLGELWAIPIMLRLAVIENLRRVSGKIALDMIDHNLADYWADRMMKTVKEKPGDLILTIADMALSKPVLASSFVSGFVRKLQGKGPALALPLSWMEQQLSEIGINSNDLVWQENQKQAADQVSVSNSIGTLRFLGATNWREFVESLSDVEKILRLDSSGTYSLMDFETRDRYRHVVEAISKSSKLSESEVAGIAINLASQFKSSDHDSSRKEHVGYYLIDKGLKITEKATLRKFTIRQAFKKWTVGRPVFLYLTSISLLTLITACGMCYIAWQFGTHGWKMLTLFTMLAISVSAHLAVSLVNWFSTIWVSPKILPRMDFSRGIPNQYRTLVVVPTMLSGKEYIEELIEGLEIRFLANREDNLYFGLLTDFLDADSEVMPDDDDLLYLVKSRIIALNQKYKHPENDIFFLFHRSRTWNASEHKWMGYERKRGKLSALNALILNRESNEFSSIVGNIPVLHKVKYVITLDSDTQIPREAAWKFIATMAHPLNAAIYSSVKKRVISGYGILQPRVASTIPKSATSLYLRIQGNVTGIDPYTRVSSDVYQDLFDEGSFIGKGIYDVAIFEQAVHQVLPENRILSHDLLEGCYTRAGLLSDVLLYEESPSQYLADIKRHHRWIRGDWQIGAWMLPFITDRNGRLTKNKLSMLSRWKILDNLRRSLLPFSILLLLILGWTILPFPWFWTLTVTAIVLLPILVAAAWRLLQKPPDLTIVAHFTEVSLSVRDVMVRFIFELAVLPYQAHVYTEAVIRTNWRMVVTRRKLLEWTPSGASAYKRQMSAGAFYLQMYIAPFMVIFISTVIYFVNPLAFYSATPFLFLWLLAPAFAWYLSNPEKDDLVELPEEQMVFLHKTARKTWSFFEKFVNDEGNWLPPDNYQEHPVAIVAYRTSPTNLGLNLLSNLSAHDFGYITSGELISRCDNSMQSMLKLERYKGHFYNWYDTLTFLPLYPRYISTVDSGNLAGHLLTLRQGLLTLGDQQIISKNIFEGLRTTAWIVRDFSNDYYDDSIEKIIILIEEGIEDSYSLSDIYLLLNKLTLLTAITEKSDASDNRKLVESERSIWSRKLSKQILDTKEYLTQLVPWIDLLPVPDHFVEFQLLNNIPTIRELQLLSDMLNPLFDFYEQQEQNLEHKEWLFKMRNIISKGSAHADELMQKTERLANFCEQLSDIEYDFLFNASTSLFRIGFNVEEQRNDNSYYDLLASEARLGVFVAIAQGKIPQESWFALGRLLTNSGGDPILLSWSGSMFEYLMPQLIMPSYDNTLLFQTSKIAVKRQIEYGVQQNIPWGISESGYNMTDANLNYQYRAFGVPGLGLKRGLEDDLVVAPYASMLGLMVSPAKACANLQLMSAEGFEGAFGFYEAIDYTKNRIPRGKEYIVVQSYMVHHLGMGLLSLAYSLLNKPMQQRFVAELRFQSTLLLLQERIPRATIFYAHTEDLIETHQNTIESKIRVINTPNTKIPELQLLSNGRYQVMITNSGGGYSRWKDIAVFRWREDTTKDNHGIFCYIKDVASGKFWSNTYQPTLHPAKVYEAVFTQGKAEFRRIDYGFETKTEIVISPEDDTEMRRLRITNRNTTLKIMEFTSYAEVVMASHASDESHPAFSNLFVQTEIRTEHKAVFCTRRPRSEEEKPPWMFHLMDVHGCTVESVSYETDRKQFVGRGNSLTHPQAMNHDLLSGKQGSVLDPVMAIRYRVSIKPNQTATIDLIYGICDTKDACEILMHKYRDQHLKRRAFELTWTHSQVLLRQINATEADAQLYDQLASSIIYANPDLRIESAVIQNNFKGQSGLWSHSVSGDLPIVLLHIFDSENMEIVRQMIQAHAYWRLKGLAVDIVILNQDHGSYRQELQDQILGLISEKAASSFVFGKPGNIFVKSFDQISLEYRVLFESVARVIMSDSKGTLAEQVNKHHVEKIMPPQLERKPYLGEEVQHTLSLPDNLLYFNGIGGFTPDGREYKIKTDRNITTPSPWVNVIANPDFGTVVSESGSAYTWAINAHEYRITPWTNDPVSDNGGEAFYIRDEDSGRTWSPAPFPMHGSSPYIITHGFGYSCFEHFENGISSEMNVFVDKTLPVKFVTLKIKNHSGRERKLSATGFLEIILGDVRSKTGMHIISERDAGNGALLFRNRYNSAFTDRVTFFKVDDVKAGFTTDRSEFIGRNSNLSHPAALYRKRLSGKSGAGMDTCAALQVKFDLLDGAEKEIIFQIGNESNTQTAKELISKFNNSESVLQSFTDVKEYWQEITSTLQVYTPNTALNILANGWLNYQTIACRIYARSGFYQSGGAFGFRDQLQDVLSLLTLRPDMVKAQILLAASRQFVEGDVQHWWHPPEGRGVRTRCSDDLLWLPFVVARYIKTTGDDAILNTEIGFLESRLLHHGEDSLYDLPISGNLKGTLYEHCVRAIRHSLQFGTHGLPLIGSGDWNDGMDKVGNRGMGESVWLAFFLYDVLMKFTEIAINKNDTDFSNICIKESKTLQDNIEASSWDGEWYLRAFFDDGTPLGSHKNKECSIDAIAQSWSVLSRAANQKRQRTAMASLDKHLVKRDLNIIQLLDPPFDKEDLNPGYIKGYVPGVRENGGQYSHAAIWALMAFAELGEREKVWELFNMIQPLSHSSDADSMNVYKVEPYVMAADVYANESHKGMGGWTWYTGSSGWMYQFITGSLLGMKLQKDQLNFKPCFPLEWPSVSLIYRFGKSVYKIEIFQKQTGETSNWIADNISGVGDTILLIDDGLEHHVEVHIANVN